VTGAGNTVAMTLALTFKPTFTGTQTAFGSAFDNASLTSGWQALGNWKSTAPAATPPTAYSVTPNAGTGTSGSFAFRYSSVNGTGYLQYVHALVNGTLNSNGACWVYYSAAVNGLYLLNDTQTGSTGPLTPGSNGTLQNSQCTLNGAGSSVIGSANTLAMTLALTFKPSFSGAQTAFGSAFDKASLASGWQTLGTWKTN
jgi:hypothetical protein